MSEVKVTQRATQIGVTVNEVEKIIAEIVCNNSDNLIKLVYGLSAEQVIILASFMLGNIISQRPNDMEKALMITEAAANLCDRLHEEARKDPQYLSNLKNVPPGQTLLLWNIPHREIPKPTDAKPN